MTVERLAISFERELARAVRKAAGEQPTSAWLADAARRKLRCEGLLGIVQEWEQGHGEISAAELHAARGKARPSRKRRAKR
jgi:hypothetical protein